VESHLFTTSAVPTAPVAVHPPPLRERVTVHPHTGPGVTVHPLTGPGVTVHSSMRQHERVPPPHSNSHPPSYSPSQVPHYATSHLPLTPPLIPPLTTPLFPPSLFLQASHPIHCTQPTPRTARPLHIPQGTWGTPQAKAGTPQDKGVTPRDKGGTPQAPRSLTPLLLPRSH